MKVEDEVLRCAECNSELMQPYQVDVFNRAGEDNDKGLHVTIADQVITQDDDVSRDAGNPSKRRSASSFYSGASSATPLPRLCWSTTRGRR